MFERVASETTGDRFRLNIMKVLFAFLIKRIAYDNETLTEQSKKETRIVGNKLVGNKRVASEITVDIFRLNIMKVLFAFLIKRVAYENGTLADIKVKQSKIDTKMLCN